MSRKYDAAKAPEPSWWLEFDDSEQRLLVEDYHHRARTHAAPENPTDHAIIHVIVENQIADHEPPGAAAAVDRLTAEGLTRHEAIHAVGGVVSGVLFGAMKEQTPFDLERYAQSLAALEAEAWLATAEDPQGLVDDFDVYAELIDDDGCPIDDAVDVYIDGIVERFEQSPEGRRCLDAGMDLWLLSPLVNYGLQYHEVTPATMEPGDLEFLLLSTFPRKVMVDATEAREIVAVARAFFQWLDREYQVVSAADCAAPLTPELARRLEEALKDPATFGMAKSLMTTGRDLGYDLETEEGLQEWVGAYNGPTAAAPIRRAAPKIGRNAPCPCGSGKKYKKCCGP